MIEFTKMTYFKTLIGDRDRLSRLSTKTFTSIFDNILVTIDKVQQTLKIYCSYRYSVQLSYEMKEKLNKHLIFANLCNSFLNIAFKYFTLLKEFENCLMDNEFENSSNIELENYFERETMKFFNECLSVFIDIISTFNESHLEDEYGSIENLLQSLWHLF